MRQWILFRDKSVDITDFSAEDLVGNFYFDLWGTRQQPFSVLEDGDTVYFLDRKSWTLTWEFRARKVLKTRYHSIPGALSYLRSAYGVFPEDLNDYIWDRPDEGYLLAWAAEVVAPMHASLPDGFRPGDLGGRNGYLLLGGLPETTRQLIVLHEPGREAVAPLPEHFAPELIQPDLPLMVARNIPSDIRRQVRVRDGGVCRTCGSDEEPLHVDHIYPWSKGGTNDLANLQLLCRTHNLAKAAAVAEGAKPPAGLGAVRRVANTLTGNRVDASAAEVVRAAVAKDRTSALIAAVRSDGSLEPDEFVAYVQALVRADVAIADEDLIEFAVQLISLNQSEDADAFALTLAESLAQHSDRQIAAAAAFVRAHDEALADEDWQRLLLAAADAEDRNVSGRACLLLAEDAIETSGFLIDEESRVDPQVVRWLERAADCPDLGTRASASLKLGIAAGERPHEADSWLRPALASPEAEVGMEAAMWLAVHNTGNPKSAMGMARWSLGSTDPFVTDRAHLVLAELLDDEDEANDHLKMAAESEDAEVIELVRDIRAARAR